MFKELFINTKKETHLSFLIMPFLNQRMYAWFYENYINLIMYVSVQKPSDVIYMMDFVDNNVDESYREFMEQRIVYSFNEINDGDKFIQYICKGIDKNFYHYISIDKYYIPGNDCHMQRHFVHPTLVFGYDDDRNEIICIDQNFDKGVNIKHVKYDDFIAAYQSIAENYIHGANILVLNDTITSFKVKTNAYMPPFRIERFLTAFYDYIYSEFNILKERKKYFYAPDMAYGISVYDKFIEVINKFDQGYWLTFKSLADFTRHKKYMLDRFEYIFKLYDINEECLSYINQYNKVYELLEKARMLGIKYDVMAGNTPGIGFSRNPEFLEKIKKLFTEAKNIEYEILPKIYWYMKNNAELKSDKKRMVNNHTIDYANSEGVHGVIRVVFSTTQIIDQISVINSHGHILSLIKIWFDNGSEIERIVDNNDKERYDIFFAPKKITYFDYILTSKTDSHHDDLAAISFKIYEIPYNIRWNFFTNRFSVGVEDIGYDDMNKSDGVQITSVGETFQCTVTNRDPCIVYTMEHHLNADKAKYIYAKYRTTCDSENAQIFFVPVTYELEAEERSKTFTIAPHNSSFEYIIDMSDKHDWKGAIRQMRFDPVSYDNQSEKGECIIDYIEMSDKAPVYGSQKDFINTQGVNGWSYYTYNQGITYREMMWDEANNLWKGIKNPELEIQKENQSSIYNFATVRRWTCPADGLYSVKCIFKQMSDGNMIDFIIKRNHLIVKKYQYDKDSGLIGVYEDRLDMATGEMISFEFCNKDWNMLAVLNIDVVIMKETDKKSLIME